MNTMIYSAGFTVADLRTLAGADAFHAAGVDVAQIDGPHEDEWSLYATISLRDGRTLETILHHGEGISLDGECDCPDGRAKVFCSHLVWVGLVHLGLDSSPAGALAGETASAADLRPWLATLSRDELTELVIEAAQGSLEGRRGLYIRRSIELPDGSTGTWPN
jgi:hypothetical protein